MTPTYLVQYGRPGFVGRFRTAHTHSLDRGDRVVIHGPRGLEIGVVLCEPAQPFTAAAADDGELLRPVSEEDEATAARLEALGREVHAAAEEGGLPLAFVDVELSLDGAAILHVIPWAECDASPLLDELSTRFALRIQLLDLSHSPSAKDEPEPAGCGKPGCGSEAGGCTSCGTGGCSTGSCSKGKVKSAEELTSYFAGLRQQMEAVAGRTPLT